MTEIATAGQASAASRISSSGPVPITTAVSSRRKTSGAISTQSPWALHSLGSTSGYVGHAASSALSLRGEVPVLDALLQGRDRARAADGEAGDRDAAAGEDGFEVALVRVALDHRPRRRGGRGRRTGSAARTGRSRSSAAAACPGTRRASPWRPRRPARRRRPSARCGRGRRSGGRRGPRRRRRRRRRAARCAPRCRCGRPSRRGRCRAARPVAGAVPTPTTTASQAIRLAAGEDQLLDPAVARGRPRASRRSAPARPRSRCSSANQRADLARRGSARAASSSASIIVTSTPSRRAVAATSWPMKPAPTIASRAPGPQLRAQPAGVGERAQGVDVLEALEEGQPAGRAAGRDQQLLVARARRRSRAATVRAAGSSASARAPSSSSTCFSSYHQAGR